LYHEQKEKGTLQGGFQLLFFKIVYFLTVLNRCPKNVLSLYQENEKLYFSGVFNYFFIQNYRCFEHINPDPDPYSKFRSGSSNSAKVDQFWILISNHARKDRGRYCTGFVKQKHNFVFHEFLSSFSLSFDPCCCQRLIKLFTSKIFDLEIKMCTQMKKTVGQLHRKDFF